MFYCLMLAIFSPNIHAEVFKPTSGAVRTFEAMDVNAVFFHCSIADRGWTRDPQLTAGADRAIKNYLIDYTSLPHAKIDAVTRAKVHKNAKDKCRELGSLDLRDFLAHKVGAYSLEARVDMGSNQPTSQEYYYAVFNCTVIIERH